MTAAQYNLLLNYLKIISLLLLVLSSAVVVVVAVFESCCICCYLMLTETPVALRYAFYFLDIFLLCCPSPGIFLSGSSLCAGNNILLVICFIFFLLLFMHNGFQVSLVAVLTRIHTQMHLSQHSYTAIGNRCFCRQQTQKALQQLKNDILEIKVKVYGFDIVFSNILVKLVEEVCLQWCCKPTHK